MRNYFAIDSFLTTFIFNNNFDEITKYQINFKSDKPLNQSEVVEVFLQKYHALNYYQFNLLIEYTKSKQETIYHKLDSKFFESFSTHKKRMYFCGFINSDGTKFTLNEIIYLIPYKKLSLFFQKRLIKTFQDCGIGIGLLKDKQFQDISRFVLVNL